MSLRPVNPSFEIGGSGFNTLKALRALIAATSEDDVHTQAVLAVEQLGACFPVAAERIDEAVTVLGGSNSVRVENLKASIGISSGGLCKVIRQSTALLQFFVLCAALKTTLLDDECSTLMFEMLKTSSVLAKLPCSAVQIMRMITQFSGQAEMIAPTDMMHEVASAVDEWHPELDTFRKMEFKVLAELLLTLFEQMRDETVDSILLGNKACLLIGDKAVKGDLKAKLCIQVELTRSVHWNLQVFKASDNPIRFVFEMSADETDSLSQIPLRLLKSFMNQYYWSAFESEEIRRKAMIASGIIAQTLVIAISQRGQLYLKCEGCNDGNRCNETPLAAIAQNSWLATAEWVITNYGWSDDGRTEFHPGLLKAILEGVDKWRGGFRGDGAEEHVKKPCRAFIDSYFSDEKVEADYILDPALFVAADATVTCTAVFENGRRFIKPLDHQILQFADETVVHILSDGIEVSEFRRLAFKQLLPGLDTWQDNDLVVARDGYVAGMNMLWFESARHSDALSIRVQGGQIKKDQVTYNSIRENTFTSYVKAGPRVPAFDVVKGLVTPEVGWQHPIQDRAYTFETSASVHGTRIEIKHYMVYMDSFSKSPHRRKASWISAINILATATHMDLESQLTAKLNQGFNMRMMKELVIEDVCWTDPFYSPTVNTGVRSLIRTGGNNMVKIFGAGACCEARTICCGVFIRHRSPLLQCIEKAESNAHIFKSWIVVD
ncbi:hypothetical protein BDZ45DRAFT_811632 [Acephala macrosclerotiorum]|nr:hypothetical protein BDZ45DRAFT_811632 [Acephala macrosclerotiorum]